MTKNEIINKWARDKVVEEIASRYEVNHPDDLCQLIYLSLCEKDEELIQHLYESNQYKFYIARMIATQVKSYESYYYRQNEKFQSDFIRMPEGFNAPDTDNSEIDEELLEKTLKEIDKLGDEERQLLIYHSQANFKDVKPILKKYRMWSSSFYLYINKLINAIKSNVIEDKSDPLPAPKKINTRGKRGKKVYAYDENGNYLAEYNNSDDAANALGLLRQSIWTSARYGKKLHNYYFSYQKLDFLKPPAIY